MELAPMTGACESYSPPPMSKRLQERKEKLEKELEKVNKAIELMGADEKMSQLLDIVSQLHI